MNILGAGPHGFEVATLYRYPKPTMFDDRLLEYPPVGRAVGPYVIGAAFPAVRREIAAKAQGTPWHDGIIIFPGAYISPTATIGEHTHVGPNAVISHGCRVGAFVQVCAGAVLGGEVVVEDDVFIGINASILHGGLTIGAGATVGAGAVVTQDVRPSVTVAGVPARQLIPAVWPA